MCVHCAGAREIIRNSPVHRIWALPATCNRMTSTFIISAECLIFASSADGCQWTDVVCMPNRRAFRCGFLVFFVFHRVEQMPNDFNLETLLIKFLSFPVCIVSHVGVRLIYFKTRTMVMHRHRHTVNCNLFSWRQVCGTVVSECIPCVSQLQAEINYSLFLAVLFPMQRRCVWVSWFSYTFYWAIR